MCPVAVGLCQPIHVFFIQDTMKAYRTVQRINKIPLVVDNITNNSHLLSQVLNCDK